MFSEACGRLPAKFEASKFEAEECHATFNRYVNAGLYLVERFEVPGITNQWYMNADFVTTRRHQNQCFSTRTRT